jgi:hypothetical protein
MQILSVSRARTDLGQLVRSVCATDGEPVGIAYGHGEPKGDHAVLISHAQLEQLRRAARPDHGPDGTEPEADAS